MIEKKVINDYFRLYSWNSETIQLEIPEEDMERVREAAITYCTTDQEGIGVLEYLRGRIHKDYVDAKDEEENDIPKDPIMAAEWMRKNLTPEALFQLGMSGILLKKLWATLFIDRLTKVIASQEFLEGKKLSEKVIDELKQISITKEQAQDENWKICLVELKNNSSYYLTRRQVYGKICPEIDKVFDICDTIKEPDKVFIQ